MVGVVNPGHDYLFHCLDGGEPVLFMFVKQDDPSKEYQDNEPIYSGMQIHEVLRTSIDHAHHVNGYSA